MRVSFSPGYHAELPEGHIFPMGKFVALHCYLLDQQILKPNQVIEPGLVDYSHLSTVHSFKYASAVLDGTLTRKEERMMGLPWSRSLAVRSQLAVQYDQCRFDGAAGWNFGESGRRDPPCNAGGW